MSLKELKKNSQPLIKKDRYEEGDIVKVSDRVQFYDDAGAYSDDDPVYNAADFEWTIGDVNTDKDGNVVEYDCYCDITIIGIRPDEIEGAIRERNKQPTKEPLEDISL